MGQLALCVQCREYNQSRCLIPMTRFRNRRHKSTPFYSAVFSYVCHADCRCGIGIVWYQMPAPIRTLFCPKPESGVHVTEMINFTLANGYNIPAIGSNKSGHLGEFIAYFAFSHVYFRSQKFSYRTCRSIMVRKTGAENGRKIMELIYDAGFWNSEAWLIWVLGNLGYTVNTRCNRHCNCFGNYM